MTFPTGLADDAVRHADDVTPNTAVRPHGVDQELVLDVVGIGLDLVGIVDPSGVSDAASGALSLARGDYLGAALSAISVVPYVGDLAKLGKVPKWLSVLVKIKERAMASVEFAAKIRPYLVEMARHLDLLPDGVMRELDELKTIIREVLERSGGAPARVLADIRETFNYRIFEKVTSAGTRVVKEVSGRLGTPGCIETFRSQAAQRAISSRTGDHAGHLAGSVFGAAEDARNLSPQNWIQNAGGTFWDLERRWETMLRRGEGVVVNIQDLYRVGETRPYVRHVTWSRIMPDGSQIDEIPEIFGNFASPRSRDALVDPPKEVLDRLAGMSDADFPAYLEHLAEEVDKYSKNLDDLVEYVDVLSGTAIR